MSLSAAAQAVVTRVTAKRSGTGDVPHDPDTDRLVLLSEVVAKLDAGAGGGGTSVKLVTVADDTAFEALTSADINVGDFLRFSSSGVPDLVQVDWVYVDSDAAEAPAIISAYKAMPRSTRTWITAMFAADNVAGSRAALGESLVAKGTVTTASTLDLNTGLVQSATLTASTACTFTMPSPVAAATFVLLLKQAAATGNGTATFTGVKWGPEGAPVISATAGKMDILTFISDGTNWYGNIKQGYTP